MSNLRSGSWPNHNGKKVVLENDIRLNYVSTGSVATPGVALGGTADVVVPISPTMPDTTYFAFTALRGGTGLLGGMVIQGITTKTTTSVTVRVAASILTTAGAGAVDVCAVRPGAS